MICWYVAQYGLQDAIGAGVGVFGMRNSYCIGQDAIRLIVQQTSVA